MPKNKKYDAAKGMEKTLSFNPLQDDLNKLADSGLPIAPGTGGKILYKSLKRAFGVLPPAAGELPKKAMKNKIKEALKKTLTSKGNIAGVSAAAGYELGKKVDGKKGGGIASKGMGAAYKGGGMATRGMGKAYLANQGSKTRK